MTDYRLQNKPVLQKIRSNQGHSKSKKNIYSTDHHKNHQIIVAIKSEGRARDNKVGKKLHAEVKLKNVASRRLFNALGFHEVSPIVTNPQIVHFSLNL